MPITFTDAEQRFADSAEGQSALAYERGKHRLSQAHKGADAAPWTDAMEASAVRQLAMQHARNAVEVSAFLADAERQLPELRDQEAAARQREIERLGNAWRGTGN